MIALFKHDRTITDIAVLLARYLSPIHSSGVIAGEQLRVGK